jgi:alpha-beta hydrolase superfamily lysophospholipase
MQHTARQTLAPFFCLALALAPATARAAPLAQTTVQAASGRSCLAFLQASPGAQGLPLVVASHGSGIYTNVHDRFPVGDAVRAGRVALLSVDKPGVRPNPDKPGEPLVDDPAYNAYTRADLVDCAAAGLAWARSQPAVAPEGPLVFFGHSEGALVALALLDQLHAKAPAEAARVRGLLLSGTPTLAFSATLADQVGVRTARKIEALARAGGDAELREFGGIGAGTLADMLDAHPYEALLGALAARGAPTSITLFHGEDDRNCDPEAVRSSFASRWERHHPADRRPLRLQLRRYPEAGHHGNAEMATDLALHAEAAWLGLGPYAPAAPPDDGLLDLSVPAEDRARLEGRYGSRRGPLPQISVVVRGDQLVAQPTGQSQLTLLYQGGLRFRADLDTDIGLHFDSAGQLVVEQGGRSFPMPKVGPPDPAVVARLAGPAPTPAGSAAP